MTQRLAILSITLLSALAFFVLGVPLWTLAGLLLVTLLTRFRVRSRDMGRYFEMLLVFLAVWFFIRELNIGYPYSLILILAILVALIFYEGPEWGAFYFGAGQTGRYFRQALAAAVVFTILFGAFLLYDFDIAENPAPYRWPLDVAVIAGIGFALYAALMHEILFRSFIYQRAVAATDDAFAVVVQALFYGLMYYNIPATNGPQGVVLGTLFGLTLGYLVKKSDSIYLSLFVNFIVVLVIFMELLVLGKIYTS